MHEAGVRGGSLDPPALLFGKDAREEAACGEMSRRPRARSRECRRAARTGRRPSAGDRLRCRCRAGKYGGLPSTRSKRSVSAKRRRRRESRLTNVVAIGQPVVGRRLSRQPHALGLRLDRDDARARQPPRGDHADGADAGAEVEDRRRGRRPRRSVPRRQHVVGREPVTVAQLKDAEVSADGVERLVWRNDRRRRRAWRNRTGLAQPLKWLRSNPNSPTRQLGKASGMAAAQR